MVTAAATKLSFTAALQEVTGDVMETVSMFYTVHESGWPFRSFHSSFWSSVKRPIQLDRSTSATPFISINHRMSNRPVFISVTVQLRWRVVVEDLLMLLILDTVKYFLFLWVKLGCRPSRAGTLLWCWLCYWSRLPNTAAGEQVTFIKED